MTRRLWVIGDSWTDPDYGGWSWAEGWPRLVAARLGLALVNTGEGGNGYVKIAGGSSLPIQAARGYGAGADAVIVWGSVNDALADAPPLDVFTAATITYDYLSRSCPDAALIVCGPQYWDDAPPAVSDSHRTAVRDAALAAGATFLDPLEWFQGRPELFDSGGTHPLPAGHALIADRVAPELLYALPPAPGERGDLLDEAVWELPLAVDAPAATLPPGSYAPEA